MRDQRDITSQTFTVTNYTEDLALDCDAVQFSGAVTTTADVLGTLIKELSEQGILSAAVTA